MANTQSKSLPKKYFKKYRKPLVELPDLIEPQRESFKWLVEQGIKEVFKEFSPISDYSEKKFDLVGPFFHDFQVVKQVGKRTEMS